MKIENTKKNRAAIRSHFRPFRRFTAENRAAMDAWVDGSKDGWTFPLIIRYSRPDLSAPMFNLDPDLAALTGFERTEGDSWISGMVCGGICAGFFSVDPTVSCRVMPGSYPMRAMVIASAITDVSLWCMELSANLEAASIMAGIPARNTSGASGATEVMTRKKMGPSLPIPFKEM